MPDPEKYTDKQEFMSDCMHQMRKVEKRPQDQSVAICLSMWRRKEEKKKNSIGEKIKKIAYMIKNSGPRFVLTDTYPFLDVDLFFERLSFEDITKIIKDLLKGETIRVPVKEDSSFYTSFSLKDLNEKEREEAEKYFKKLLTTGYYRNKEEKKLFSYDEKNKIYLREKKEVLKGKVFR